MNWFSSSRGLAGGDAADAGPALATHQERTEALRSAMLEALAGIGPAPEARALMHRIHFAGDAVCLWYMRPEVMSMLASHHGEAVARQTLARLGIHFQGILPQGLASQLRPTGRAGAAASFFPPA